MKDNFQSKGVTSQVVLGLLVILMGMLLLLDNLDFIDIRRVLGFWPMVFIIAGTVKLCDTQSRNSQLLGGLLAGLGVLMILDRMDIIDFNIRTLWPLFLIGAGAFVLYKALDARRAGPTASLKDEADPGSDVVDVAAIVGGFERRVTTQNFRGGEITAVMGGCSLDMRTASIQDEAVINVFAFWGGVTIKCPPDWTVVLQGTPIMGGFEEKTATPPHSQKRLIIRGYAIMGGVEVRN
ncbi:LiaI-LiaF-like domain-containing protein [Massilia sp.]|uniref:LiaI-LiaF-like domain-containing protein n=1 Tax=Massilia sp. TaxID=1882437 RepID=UPI00391C2F1E